MATITLPVRSYSEKANLSKTVLEVGVLDVQYVIRHLSAQEIDAQIQAKNPPSHILVDGRDSSRRGIDQARTRVRAFFADANTVLRAVHEAWALVMRNSKRGMRPPHAVDEYEIWSSENFWRTGKKIGNNPSALTTDMITSKTVVGIVGPWVPYTRKYRFYYGRIGGQKIRLRKSSNKRLAQQGVKVALSLHEIAAKAVKSKFPALGVKEIWVDVPNQNPGGQTPVVRIPSVSIWTKKKGRLNG